MVCGHVNCTQIRGVFMTGKENWKEFKEKCNYRVETDYAGGRICCMHPRNFDEFCDKKYCIAYRKPEQE